MQTAISPAAETSRTPAKKDALQAIAGIPRIPGRAGFAGTSRPVQHRHNREFEPHLLGGFPAATVSPAPRAAHPRAVSAGGIGLGGHSLDLESHQHAEGRPVDHDAGSRNSRRGAHAASGQQASGAGTDPPPLRDRLHADRAVPDEPRSCDGAARHRRCRVCPRRTVGAAPGHPSAVRPGRFLGGSPAVRHPRTS